MDDCCAVCAEPLEWVAYGPCSHRDVCSTCVARLRFICHDPRCCICKTHCDVVFVTKALGDYTTMINDFSSLPSDVREGRVGPYWYHEDTNAFFDDVDHYKMIKAMCRLSCTLCDKMDENASNRRPRFRNLEQLKGHLFHRHKLLMCTLCLEGRKVFICEQKLYTRAQLNQHISTGDSEVDGTESERGGFMGHPMCEFCRTPFYGDNELYTHMSTEHYTCHICQRQHPGQYEYYKNYDDLEIHFRQEHFLCEDEACLAKKFIVFQSEAEMKRHNAVEHGGRMSRSRRNAALQIPTSFLYRRGNEQGHRRGRGHTFRRDNTERQLSMAIEASLETVHAEHMVHDPPAANNGQIGVDDGNADIDSVIQPFESLGTADSESSSRYRQALGQNSRSTPLGDSSFPPLPVASSSSGQQKPKPVSEDSSFPPLPTASSNGQKPKHRSKVSSSKTMAAQLRRKNNVIVIHSADAWPAANHGSVTSIPSSSNISQSRSSTNITPGVSRNSSHVSAVISSEPASSTYANSIQAAHRTAHGQLSPGPSRDKRDNGRIVHSASAPNLSERSPAEPSHSDFPPVSSTQVSKLPTSSRSLLKAEDIHTANKSLVEKIRGALDFDEDRYTLFKDISAQYRQGIVDTGIYLDFVQQFGLSHLVLDLARLCPDPQKQKELVESYNASLQRIDRKENDSSRTSTFDKNGNFSRKGKGKSVDAGECNSKERLTDSFLSTVRQLQLNNGLPEEKLEVLSKDDYRTNKGKGKLKAEPHIDANSPSQPMMKLGGQSVASSGSSSNQNRDNGGGGSKQRKKSSKFLRVRLGDGSVKALLDTRNSQTDSEDPDGLEGNKSDPGALPVRGVWRNKGGQKLFS